MINITSASSISTTCPYCSSETENKKVVWQGINVCIKSFCQNCELDILTSLPVGHTKYYPFQIDLKTGKLFGNPRGFSWIASSTLNSIKNINHEKIIINKIEQKRTKCKKVVIINCLDFLYGHCVLKLFNAQQYKKQEIKVIILIPRCIDWLVPNYVHEVWVADIELYNAYQYYTALENFIQKELKKYEQVNLCDTNCHPFGIVIEDFSRVQPNRGSDYKIITYYWRSDRVSLGNVLRDNSVISIIQRFILLHVEKCKLIVFFSILKRTLPDYTFVLVGVGRDMSFPRWIKDLRSQKFSARDDKKFCEVFAKSTIVIGTQGSHMILPAAHSLMSLELYQNDRLEYIGQNMILPHHTSEEDERLRYFKNRFLPVRTSFQTLSKTIISMIKDYEFSKLYFNRKSINRHSQ